MSDCVLVCSIVFGLIVLFIWLLQYGFVLSLLVYGLFWLFGLICCF